MAASDQKVLAEDPPEEAPEQAAKKATGWFDQNCDRGLKDNNIVVVTNKAIKQLPLRNQPMNKAPAHLYAIMYIQLPVTVTDLLVSTSSKTCRLKLIIIAMDSFEHNEHLLTEFYSYFNIPAAYVKCVLIYNPQHCLVKPQIM